MTAPSDLHPSARLAPVLERIDRDLERSIDRLREFLAIPSVSTDPAFAADTARAGRWAVAQLTDLGFSARLVDTPGHPMVLAHHPGPGHGEAILYYGHYDVQPADPLELWRSGPFDPVLEESPLGRRIVARGACDDKGQVMTFIEAFRAWREVHGGPPVPVTVLLEGEEESGSPSLEPFLEAHRDSLRAAVCVVSDTGMWDAATPAITTMLRGLVYTEVRVKGPGHDLHSGMYGGTLANPLNALVASLARLHDRDGRVAIPGFFEGIEEPPAEMLACWQALPFDESEFLASAGVERPFGEPGRTTMERMWSRPTCDLNGLFGGYAGQGAKTVIPAEAGAKLSCRLVPGQDPKRIADLLEAFIREGLPPGIEATFHRHGASPAIGVPIDSPQMRAARRGLAIAYGRDAAMIGTGGSIPAVGAIRRHLGIDSILAGFGLDDDRVHSPNEKFEVCCLQGGIRAHAAMLEAFAEARSA